jgi:2-octaprenyl-6-methoxyphenol hydroxylase
MSLIADRYAADRLALVGEAAHAMPPIGAQGLNLGLTDVATLTEVLQDARARGQDIGAGAVLAAYERARRPDVLARVAAVDGLNRAVMSKWAPLQALRHLGLSAVDRMGPVKHRLMRQGMQPVGRVPALMRPAAAPEPAGRR